MSAFIMEQTGFATLANELAARWNDRTIYSMKHLIWRWLNDFEDESALAYDASNLDVADAIKQKLDILEMANYRAVNDRYNDHESTPVNHYPINFHSMRKWSNVQLFKNLQCLRYQMSEGDVPNSRSYMDLERLLAGVAEHIVSQTNEYDKAAWGW